MQRCLRLAAAMVFVGVVFFFPLLAPIAHRIDDPHFSMIRRGMSRSDVEAIFGVKPGAYDGLAMSPLTVYGHLDWAGPEPVPCQVAGARNDESTGWWIAEQGVYKILFYDGVVCQGDFVGRPIQQPLLIRWWETLKRSCGLGA